MRGTSPEVQKGHLKGNVKVLMRHELYVCVFVCVSVVVKQHQVTQCGPHLTFTVITGSIYGSDDECLHVPGVQFTVHSVVC